MRKIGLFLISLIISIMVVCLCETSADVLEVKSTAYCYNSGTTSTGTIPTEGRTLAGNPAWYGKTVVVWENKGNGIEPQNYIGTYICEDTGGEPIRKGYVIDIFIKDKERAFQYGSKDVIIQIIDAKG